MLRMCFRHFYVNPTSFTIQANSVISMFLTCLTFYAFNAKSAFAAFDANTVIYVFLTFHAFPVYCDILTFPACLTFHVNLVLDANYANSTFFTLLVASAFDTIP